MLSLDVAQRFATSTLGHVSREYPHGLAHVMDRPDEITPSGLHPIFFGSFDWHSCVHGWWQLHRLARLFPALAPEIVSRAESVFTPENAKRELEYLQNHPSFERPYGWAWLLSLHDETVRLDIAWEPNLRPLAELISTRFKTYLPRLLYPVRAGTHANTAFALILAHDWASHHDSGLKTHIEQWAIDRFTKDIAAPHLEPSGEDFLSPTLTEAVLMSRVLPKAEFETWFSGFLQELPENLLRPVTVSDRSDGRIGHLDGLHLSRAWCWYQLAKQLPTIHKAATESALIQLEAAMPHLEANYMSEHWLCTFALLALSE